MTKSKHPGAVALGSIRSDRKAAAARLNGNKPCAPGKRRGPPLLRDRLARIAQLLEQVDDERGRQFHMDPLSAGRFAEALRIAKGEKA